MIEGYFIPKKLGALKAKVQEELKRVNDETATHKRLMKRYSDDKNVLVHMSKEHAVSMAEHRLLKMFAKWIDEEVQNDPNEDPLC